MKRNTVIVIVVIVLLLICGALVYASYIKEETSEPSSDPASTEEIAADTQQKPTSISSQAGGRYVDYSAKAVAAESFEETILFFHASWCVECRGFDKAIKADDIPKGVQILKVDYDNATDLRKKYGVTIQSTFVKVDSDGGKESLWSGYGKEKSVDAILENT